MAFLVSCYVKNFVELLGDGPFSAKEDLRRDFSDLTKLLNRVQSNVAESAQLILIKAHSAFCAGVELDEFDVNDTERVR